MAVEFLESKRGRNLVVYHNYIYRKETSYKEKTFWKCVQYDNVRCMGRLQLVNNNVFKVTEHSHPPNSANVCARKVLTQIKTTSKQTNDDPQEIIANVCRDIAPAVLAELPKFNSLKRAINTQRSTGEVVANCRSLQDLIIPERYKTINNVQFLLFDEQFGEDRILIFSTEDNLEFLVRNQNWFCDGTFKASPVLFNQLYTIHAIENGLSIPVVYGLLSSRSEHIYTRFFEAVRNLNRNLNPKTIMTDFEKASHNAIVAVFPTAKHSGCFFHYKQCLYRKIQGCPEWIGRYNSEPDVACNLKKLGALAFVPPEDVLSAYEDLLKTPFYTENADSLSVILDYMESVWLGRMMRGNRRKQGLYPIKLWNQCENVLNGLHKTNNCVESWHNTFNRLLGAQHPTLWKLIEGLSKQQTINAVKVCQLRRGDVVPKKKKVLSTDQRLQTLLDRYSKDDKVGFLNTIVYTI